jgi:hypothetical protein
MIFKNVKALDVRFIGQGIKKFEFFDQLQSNFFIVPLLINLNLALDSHRNYNILICMHGLDCSVAHSHIDVVPDILDFNVIVHFV